jgi:hypothetical protein
MDFRTAVEQHKAWWKPEPPDIPAMGLFKALRNFIHHVLKSRQNPPIGVDWHAHAEEALGDMFMYLMSVSHACNKTLTLPKEVEYGNAPAEELVILLSNSFHDLLHDAVYAYLLDRPLVHAMRVVCISCKVCAVDPMKAIERCLAKLK